MLVIAVKAFFIGYALFLCAVFGASLFAAAAPEPAPIKES